MMGGGGGGGNPVKINPFFVNWALCKAERVPGAARAHGGVTEQFEEARRTSARGRATVSARWWFLSVGRR